MSNAFSACSSSHWWQLTFVSCLLFYLSMRSSLTPPPPRYPSFLWCVGYVRMPRPLVGWAYPTPPPFCSQFILHDGALVYSKKKNTSKQFAFFVKFTLSNGVAGDRSSKTNDRISGCTVFLRDVAIGNKGIEKHDVNDEKEMSRKQHSRERFCLAGILQCDRQLIRRSERQWGES